MEESTILQVEEISKHFGRIVALDGVSFNLQAGEILGLIGPNGSGKTTLLNTLNGIHKPDDGTIRLLGTSTARLRPSQMAVMGITRTFQNARVFRTITALQNMLVPMIHIHLPAHEVNEKAIHLLDFVGLKKHAHVPASELSGGQQKLLEFARALMTSPKLVLMDEPFGGVHPEIKATLLERIVEVKKQNTSFIIVSHEIPDLMNLSRSVICMNQGKIICHGSPTEVIENELVIEAYLGHSNTVGGVQ
jgi:ABC-type branched-subunit amino acid transport system ATPase component